MNGNIWYTELQRRMSESRTQPNPDPNCFRRHSKWQLKKKIFFENFDSSSELQTLRERAVPRLIVSCAACDIQRRHACNKQKAIRRPLDLLSLVFKAASCHIFLVSLVLQAQRDTTSGYK